MLINFGQLVSWGQVVTDVVMWVALALTVISLIDYLVKNKGVMAKQK